MNKWLIYPILLSSFLLDIFQFHVGIVPRYVTWIPEMLSMVTLGIVCFQLVVKKKVQIDIKYIYLLGVYFALMFIGIILNDVPGLSVFAGMRVHFKHLPLFFLPALYEFSADEFKSQLMLIAPLLVLQLPVAVFQRFFTLAGKSTGDVVGGTLGASGVLSIVMICAIAVVLGFYVKKQITTKTFLILVLCWFIPTTINETKVTFVLLPIAILLPLFFSNAFSESQALRKSLVIGFVGVLFVVILVPTYDYLAERTPGKEPTLSKLFETKKERTFLERYMYRGVSKYKKGEDLGRVDLIALTFQEMSKDWITLIFGSGIGYTTEFYLTSTNKSSSISNSSRAREKNYSKANLQYRAGDLTVTKVFWEFGLAGGFVFVLFFVFLYRDARFLSNMEGIFGQFALGWSAVLVIISVCLLYLNILRPNSINIPLWFFSGIVAAKTYRFRLLHRYRTEGVYISRFNQFLGAAVSSKEQLNNFIIGRLTELTGVGVMRRPHGPRKLPWAGPVFE
jgi:hypothetical protein